MSSSVSRDCSPPMVTHIGTTVTPLASARDVGNEAALSVNTATVSSWPLVAGPRSACRGCHGPTANG
jgi:hypothetical protein